MENNNKKEDSNLKENTKKENKFLKSMFIIVTVLYTIFAAVIVIPFLIILFVDFSFGNLLSTLIVSVPILAPYTLYLGKKGVKDNMKSIVIIESIILCVVIFFFWFAWPMIENNLNTHPCNISTYNGIDSRYDNPCG